MDVSILNNVKKILGIEPDYTAFDLDIITHINTALSTLTQLGIGPADGFMIEDATSTWDDFLGLSNVKMVAVKSYVYLKVRMIFDPPTTSYVIDALQSQIHEMEWRLSVTRENDSWVDPAPAPVPDVDDDDWDDWFPA